MTVPLLTSLGGVVLCFVSFSFFPFLSATVYIHSWVMRKRTNDVPLSLTIRGVWFLVCWLIFGRHLMVPFLQLNTHSCLCYIFLISDKDLRVLYAVQTDWVALLPFCFFEFNPSRRRWKHSWRCSSYTLQIVEGKCRLLFLSVHAQEPAARSVSSPRWKLFASLLSADEMSFVALWPLAQQTYKGRGENDPLHGVIFLACFSCFAATNEGFILCRTRVPGTNRAPKRRLTWQSSLRG